jgi:hypothetical protein
LPLAALALTVAGARPGAAEDTSGGGPTVVELFTSQGCYSCPPAEAFLAELAGEDGMLALEFHVDYWDDLVYGAAGRWKDPFSSPAHTRRQQVYNQQIRGRPNVYTPQMVIDGRYEAVGSRRGAVDGAAVASVDVGAGSGGSAGVWLVRFLRERRTEVRAGENKGKSLVSRHIVTEMRRIGGWDGGAAALSVSGFVLADGEGCAVLVQRDSQGPVLGAASCPAPGS